MSVAILEINDSKLVVHQDGKLLLESPGFITIDGKQAFVGYASLARVKRMPLRTEYQFWQRLGMDLLDQPNKLARTQADLAFMHLQDCWQSLKAHKVENLMLVVPGDVDRGQLGLLLGMARRLGMPVRAVVDAAVASSAAPVPGRRLFHLDLHLHRCVLTELEQAAWLTRVEANSSNEVGLVRLREAWAHVAAGLFVQSTRFDPLHDAEVEQAMFDQLLQWGQVLAKHPHVDVELSHGERRHAVRLHRRHILRAAEPIYRRLREFVAEALPREKPVTIQISAHMAALPGLLESLELLSDTEIVVLDPLSARLGVQRLYLGRPSAEESVPYVCRCPWFSATDIDSHQGLIDGYQRRQPTHVLHHSVAYPLTNGQFSVGTRLDPAQDGIQLEQRVPGVIACHFRLQSKDGRIQLEDLSGGATILNDDAATGLCDVTVGDRIRIGNPGAEFMLIAVNENNGG